MVSTPTSAEAMTIRPARADDFPVIANLLLQLYQFELPGAFSGSLSGQQRLLEYTLRAQELQGVRDRYVACNSAGQVVATAVMELPGSIAYDKAPAGTVGQAWQLLGPRATLQMLLTVAKSLVPVPGSDEGQAAWLHSVVVGQQYRGRGVGKQLMAFLEQRARQAACREVGLQVLALNESAVQMYHHLGYEVQWSAPRWQQIISWPSYVMVKLLGVEG